MPRLRFLASKTYSTLKFTGQANSNPRKISHATSGSVPAGSKVKIVKSSLLDLTAQLLARNWSS